LLFEQAFLARDLELLIDMPELEQQRRTEGVNDRNGARQMQSRLAVDAELQLLFGVRRAALKRLGDSLEKRRRVSEQRSRVVPAQLPLRKLKQIFRSGIRVTDLEFFVEQQDGGGQQLQPGVRSWWIVG